jgi:hypothetical protein
MVPIDLQLYIDAAGRLLHRESLYPVGDQIEIYQYSPPYALAFTPFLLLSPAATAILHTLLHLAAYGLLYVVWARIFEEQGQARARRMLVWTLPLWLLFSAFWSDLGYLNIYIPVALLASLLIRAVLNERLGGSLVWLSIILQIKPHWAFAAAVPLLLGRYRFFLKLLAGAAVIYLAVVGLTVWVVGPAYGAQQYLEYGRLLWNMRGDFPWRGPAAPFLGYNHSITQIVVYLWGVSPQALALATAIKGLLLVPLGLVAVRALRRPPEDSAGAAGHPGLDLAFALYLGAFIWLDMVWELSLGIAAFPYLLATLRRRAERALVVAVFVPYALLDLWQLVSFGVLGDAVMAPGPYILTDPSVHVPLIMVVILIFYALLLKRTWRLTRTTSREGVDHGI